MFSLALLAQPRFYRGQCALFCVHSFNRQEAVYWTASCGAADPIRG